MKLSFVTILLLFFKINFETFLAHGKGPDDVFPLQRGYIIINVLRYVLIIQYTIHRGFKLLGLGLQKIVSKRK